MEESETLSMLVLRATHEEGLLKAIDQSSNLTEAKLESDFFTGGVVIQKGPLLGNEKSTEPNACTFR